MGKAGRDWMQVYAIYGMDEWHSLVLTLLQGSVLSVSSFLFLAYFGQICNFLAKSFPVLPIHAWSFVAGFVGALMALLAVMYFITAANIWYSDVILNWKMAQRMVGMVFDWSNVKTALDVGCGRGILLNAVATQLKKEGSCGRVVGVDLWLDAQRTMSTTLRTAAIEGVQEKVTCRSGDARNLPFSDNYFDVVVSGVFLHTVGKEFGFKSSAAAAERNKALQEIVRVLKPGGTAVVWDLVCVPEYVLRLHELKMEDIQVSECVAAFMVKSHIVSFRKPYSQVQLNGHDWRSSIA
uniref:TSA: Wollemia nobilis Ref_Wollemi_Transcript_25345_1465 transcribed RNA sequence n=1 Tax=Wollemia nobilis TaxID=56998 RepID=A0A0C9S4D3_9CONI